MFCLRRQLGLSSAEYAQDYGDDGNHQEDVNESSHGVGAHQAEEPEDDENDGDSFEHEVINWVSERLVEF